MTKKKFLEIKKKYGKFCSFAIWGTNLDDLSIFEKNIAGLRTDIVFVGLNATAPMKDFQNFHSESRSDCRLGGVLNNSSAKGAYLTDIDKRNTLVDSRKILALIRKDEKRYKLPLDKEFNDVEAKNSRIIAMGSATYQILRRWYPNGNVHKMYHPAAWQISETCFQQSAKKAIQASKKHEKR